MNKAPLIVAIAALALAAFQQIQIGSLKKRLSAPTAATAKEEAAKNDDFEVRLDELEARIARLGRVAIQDPSRGAISEEEIEAIKEDVSAAAADRALASGEGRERLRTAIREEQTALDEERRQERATRMKEMRDERLAKFIDEAKLSDAQAKAISGTYEEEWKTMSTLFEDVRGGAKSWQDVRGEMHTVRAATDERVQQTVDSQQYAAWTTMREENSPGGPGGPRRARD